MGREEQLDQFIARFTPEIAALAELALAKMHGRWVCHDTFKCCDTFSASQLHALTGRLITVEGISE